LLPLSASNVTVLFEAERVPVSSGKGLGAAKFLLHEGKKNKDAGMEKETI
jgi:hypothetical protein